MFSGKLRPCVSRFKASASLDGARGLIDQPTLFSRPQVRIQNALVSSDQLLMMTRQLSGP